MNVLLETNQYVAFEGANLHGEPALDVLTNFWLDVPKRKLLRSDNVLEKFRFVKWGKA